MTSEIVILGAARTPIGCFLGSFSKVPAHQLGAIASKEAAKRAYVSTEEIDEVIFGQALTATQGQNPARQAAIAAGLRNESTAMTINQVCGSGLRSVAIGAQQIMTGDAAIVLAGGQENMSMSPHCASLRFGKKMQDLSLVDSMLKDGLLDAFNGYHMGITAENIASRWDITREAQDRFAALSQNKAETAQKNGRFIDEIVSVTVEDRKVSKVINTDEYVRYGTTVEGLAKLKPAFKSDGTVTAGNSSGINDGAAVMLLMSAKQAADRGLTPLAKIVSWATTGTDPEIMGIGPVPSAKLALKKAGWSVSDLDLIESNEAFAAQSIAVIRELGLDPTKVNVNGGAIALGHPIGASGARILVTLIYEMIHRRASKGLATLCVGGGMGVAITVERKN